MKVRVLLLALVIALPLILIEGSKVSAQLPTLRQPPNGWTVDTLNPSFSWESDGYSQFRIAKSGSATPLVEAVLPKGQNFYTITTPLEPATAYRWRVRSNPYPPGQSIFTWSTWSWEFSFTTPGGVSWGNAAAIRLLSPVNGTLSSTIAPTLSWLAPPGATHFEMIITPAGNEAASVRFVNEIDSRYAIPGPPLWYGMLPDTQYYWRVRVNNAKVPVPDDHPSWGSWSDAWAFRTPVPSSEIIGPVSPSHGAVVSSTTPILIWGNPNEEVFYYEIQVSKDPNFVNDPQKASAPVYWESIHGGLTTPKNSYHVSSKYHLELGQTYYWRLRPAIPQSTRQAGWSSTWSFRIE